MSMKKFIVAHLDGKFIIILHAAPSKTGTFQWYWMNDQNDDHRINIEDEVYESIILSSDDIKEYYQGKWLACHCNIDDENSSYNEGSVFLTANFGEMIRKNRFDSIAFFGNDGNICSNFEYVPMSPVIKACVDYNESVWHRRYNLTDEGLCFRNDFDKAMASAKKELKELIPDIDVRLHSIELDTLIDLVADKMCETLRNKGFLSEESKEILCR